MIETAQMTLSDGRTLAWSELGDPAGHVVLSCLGTPHSRRPHPDDHASAVAAGVRVIAPERPGFGLSDPLPARSVDGWHDDARQLLDHLGVHEFSAMGASGGGPYAVATAALLPDRVTRLALVATGVPGPALDAGEHARLQPDRLAARGAQLAGAVEDPEAFRAATGIVLNPWLTAMLTEAFRQGPEAYVTDHLLNATDWSPLLARVVAPVRVWHGESDDNIRLASVRWLLARLSHAELTVVPDAGHDIADRWPEIFRWLRAAAPTSGPPAR